ncbi:MAG: transglutaminase domain-containing protein [Chloroflexi bacterium]|nr:MAG: transglutaminase domain-containing protein [Chloroflexota bacterium]
MPAISVLDYYCEPGPITRLDRYAEFLNWLTDDTRAIYQVVQSLLVHDLWIERYGSPLDPAQEYDTRIAYMEDWLDKAIQLDPRSLALPRAVERRVICCCREFATLFCAMLRFKGIPARSRCGFGRYFGVGWFEDHWICEYWDAAQSRWVQADPQLDPFQQSFLKLPCSPQDLPPGAFWVAGEAWLKSRSGKIDPMSCGISCDPKPYGLDTLNGLWFTRGQLLRDFAALNKVETVPFLVRLSKGLNWNSWRLVGARDEELSEADYRLLDHIAALSLEPDENLTEIRALYESTLDLQAPQEILKR